ncbi:hypothetical protein [Bifidobacterium actinocoloniiforme]|nr:hypothetical protein [Bifidobacterium actinocoloniiforme]
MQADQQRRSWVISQPAGQLSPAHSILNPYRQRLAGERVDTVYESGEAE